MDIKKAKVVIVMPAYNAAKTVKATFEELPKDLRQNVILVDDQSKDNTVEVSKKLGITVFSHPQNLGYGGNQKTCYWEALKLKPDVVVMLHPDYQYDASLTEEMIRPILQGRYDFMFGSRIQTKGGALKGGMPPLKYYINRIVCFMENILLGVNFTEHFSGFRAFSRNLLETVPFQRFSNDFVFDQQMEISALRVMDLISERSLFQLDITTRHHPLNS
jgi:glycosyltransferase involved in cell wall biosynthesis